MLYFTSSICLLMSLRLAAYSSFNWAIASSCSLLFNSIATVLSAFNWTSFAVNELTKSLCSCSKFFNDFCASFIWAVFDFKFSFSFSLTFSSLESKYSFSLLILSFSCSKSNFKALNSSSLIFDSSWYFLSSDTTKSLYLFINSDSVSFSFSFKSLVICSEFSD